MSILTENKAAFKQHLSSFDNNQHYLIASGWQSRCFVDFLLPEVNSFQGSFVKMSKHCYGKAGFEQQSLDNILWYTSQ